MQTAKSKEQPHDDIKPIQYDDITPIQFGRFPQHQEDGRGRRRISYGHDANVNGRVPQNGPLGDTSKAQRITQDRRRQY